uniref:Uncharacterized protein n=1 Tax=Oryza nivara TaxID=4536 RepID=A0A0E0I8H4_ORYNI
MAGVGGGSGRRRPACYDRQRFDSFLGEGLGTTRILTPCVVGVEMVGGSGLARRAARPALQAGDLEAGASALQTEDAGRRPCRGRQQRSGSSRLVAPGRGAASVGRGGCEASAGRGRASGRGGVSFAQPCSEIRGQRKNGRLGGDDLRLASYVFDGMPARKERGRNRRERWGAGPLAAQQSLLGGIILKISTNLFLNGIVVRSGIFGTALKSLEVSKIEVALRLGTDL